MEINFLKAGTAQMYPMFNYNLHVRHNLKVIRNRKLICGIDFGYRHPALVVTQVSPLDQLVVLAELMGTDITIENFAKDMLKLLKTMFPYHYSDRKRLIEWYCDPAGNQMNDKSEITSIQLLRRKFNIYAKWKRVGIKEGVRLMQHLMNKRKDDTTGLLVDSACKTIIEGFQGGYQEQPTLGTRASKELPLSDEWFAHLQDAMRYVIINKFPLYGRPYRPKQNKLGFDPLSDDFYNSISSKQRATTGYY